MKSQRPEERVDIRKERLTHVNRGKFNFDLDAHNG